MFVQRSRFSFLLASSLLLAASYSQAQAADKPAVLKALEDQGLTVLQEFKVGDGLRAFAAAAGDRPVAVYITKEGNAIVGTRFSAKGEPIDEATLGNLVAKPISDQEWALLQATRYVVDGKANAPRVVYTFSDANCPYCHRFWEAARPWVDSGKVQLRHVMVGVIRESSPGKAAAILGASDPSAALLENEKNYDQGGIAPAKEVPADIRKVLEDNHKLMLAMGFRGTPGIIVRGDDGLIKKYKGMPQPQALEELFGPR